jgi:heme/copper-type cytochrome/quinol oxidase subunit 2
MPIAIQVVSKEDFAEWVKNAGTKTASSDSKISFAKVQGN